MLATPDSDYCSVTCPINCFLEPLQAIAVNCIVVLIGAVPALMVSNVLMLLLLVLAYREDSNYTCMADRSLLNCCLPARVVTDLPEGDHHTAGRRAKQARWRRDDLSSCHGW